eukprot:81546-Hanusia_phi.AAC.1
MDLLLQHKPSSSSASQPAKTDLRSSSSSSSLYCFSSSSSLSRLPPSSSDSLLSNISPDNYEAAAKLMKDPQFLSRGKRGREGGRIEREGGMGGREGGREGGRNEREGERERRDRRSGWAEEDADDRHDEGDESGGAGWHAQRKGPNEQQAMDS